MSESNGHDPADILSVFVKLDLVFLRFHAFLMKDTV